MPFLPPWWDKINVVNCLQQRVNKNKLSPSALNPKPNVYQDTVWLLGYHYPMQPTIFVKNEFYHPFKSLLCLLAFFFFFFFLLSGLDENCSADRNTSALNGNYFATDPLSSLHSPIQTSPSHHGPKKIHKNHSLLVLLFNKYFILPLAQLFFTFKLSLK